MVKTRLKTFKFLTLLITLNNDYFFFKTKKVKNKIDLEFEVLNYVIAPKTNLRTIKTINIE